MLPTQNSLPAGFVSSPSCFFSGFVSSLSSLPVGLVSSPSCCSSGCVSSLSFLPAGLASHALPFLPPHPGSPLVGRLVKLLHPPSHLWPELPPQQLPAAKQGLPSRRFLAMPGFLPSHSWQHNISGGKHNAFSHFLFFPHCLDRLSYRQGSKGKMALPQLLQLKLQPFHLLQLASSWLSFRPPFEIVVPKLFFA